MAAQPTLVDPRGPRFAAGLTTAVLALALGTGATWLLILQGLVFALGVAGRSPYLAVYRRLVRPRLGPPPGLEDVRPLRFAQTLGLAFTGTALAGVWAGLGALTAAATAAALAAAFLNAAFGVCLGCEVYLLLRRVHPSPSTTTRTEVPA